MGRWYTVLGICLLALPLLAVRGGDANEAATQERLRSDDEPGLRLREGTKLSEVVGQFDFAGDRVAFFPEESKDSFRVLENLALERVSRLLEEGRSKPQWVVSGTVTEFRGINYLLLSRAVVQSSEPASGR